MLASLVILLVGRQNGNVFAASAIRLGTVRCSLISLSRSGSILGRIALKT